MGEWIETCILSKLPIEEKEYCVMLVGKNLLTNIFDINKLMPMFNSSPYPDMQIYKGLYQGRGTLEDMEEIEDDKESIFVNYAVWTWLILIYNDLELARTKQSYREDFEEDKIKYRRLNRSYTEEYMRVSYSATLLRLVPNSVRLKGATEIRLEEFGLWLRLLTNLNNNKINSKKND